MTPEFRIGERLTREQMQAVARIYQRSEITTTMGQTGIIKHDKPISLLEFRRHVHRPVRKDDCAMVWWKGMWLGIEPDGYTHS